MAPAGTGYGEGVDGDGSAAGLSAENARVEIAGSEGPRTRVVDVRSFDEYSEAHIPGALLVEDGDAEAVAKAIEGEERVERWVIACPDGERGRELASELGERGVEAAYLETGMAGWVKEDNATQPPPED